MIIERRGGEEFLDMAPGSYTPAELEGSLEDLARINRSLGNLQAVKKHLALLMAGRIWKEIRLLDVATGIADIPVALAEEGRRTGVRYSITGLDSKPDVLETARRKTGGYPEIELQLGDALRLPFEGQSFDIVICSKLLHHFDQADGLRLLQEIIRVARFGYLLVDLRRSRVAWLLITILAELFSRNRLTRHDGPLSVLKAYTPAELSAMAVAAHAKGFRVSRERFWLMALTGVLR